MKRVRTIVRREEVEFFLRLHGLWAGIIHLPRPPPPPFDVETMEPIEPPWQAVKEWIPDDDPDLDWFNRPRNPSSPPQTASTSGHHGDPKKSPLATAGLWFSMSPEGLKRQKKATVSEYLGTAARGATLSLRGFPSEITSCRHIPANSGRFLP